MKGISILLLLFAIQYGIAQEVTSKKTNHFLELGMNGSMIRLNGDITYRLNIKKFSFSVRYGYGQMGKKKYANTTERDGYGFIHPGYYANPNYYDISFIHDFIGSSVGIGLGGNIFIGERQTVSLATTIDYYVVKDRFNYSIKSKTTEDESNVKTTISGQNLALGLEFHYYYKINKLIAIKGGLSFPLIMIASFSPNSNAYQPDNMRFPLYGAEPYLALGVQFSLSK
jgi:hypothetical protein